MPTHWPSCWPSHWLPRRPSGPVRQLLPLGALVTAAMLALTACNGDATAGTQAGDSAGEASGSPSVIPTAQVQVTTDAKGRAVPVNHVLHVKAQDGTLKSVTVTGVRTKASTDKSDPGVLKGTLSGDGTRWTASGRLQPGARYTVRTVAVDGAGNAAQSRSRFTTQALSLDQQTYPSIAPLAGETVGVGMPVIVTFDVPVTDKAAIEKHLSVESSPVQQGSWHWISDSEVRWRPRTYWKAGTDVTVHADIDSIPAGNGVYGQLSRTTKFHIGKSVIMHVDVARHQMKVDVDGKVVRTIPVTAGAPGFTTRSGIKVIIEKFRYKDMNSETIGIEPGDPNYYDMRNVEYAQRVTFSGEFLHAAPWSEGSQGYANVSHGCVGMSTANAAWLYGITKRGDVVDVTGTDRQMTLDNGYGDWNESFAQYRKGSALK
ncbi:MAG: Ig-like domain-containing protein [Nocardioidaceae bacterium]